ncbi:MAG: hypothetical protein WAN71_17605 [Mycobacterium sp.]|uniref:hypothetical protein n=1 Tax=Mycobacterium sp. TaxID=1785 RepID=UPI003BAF435C
MTLKRYAERRTRSRDDPKRFTVPLIIDPNFTAIGHFSSIFIGLLFYPIARTRGRPPVNPTQLFVVPKSG